ncbi:MAG: GNAT family protein [Cyanobacteria bacterium P01_A01_bin.17]
MSLHVFIRRPTEADCPALLSLHRRSREFYAPWIAPLLTEADCMAYINRCQREDVEGSLICCATTQKIVGVANLSQIFYGPFQNAYLGYYADVDFVGKGLMTEGLRLVIDHAFKKLRLHRVEANIQTGNTASINVVKRLNFTKEGFSERYLKINGKWRDHERWALTVENWSS